MPARREAEAAALAASVTAYLEMGGKITRLPGFEYKPLRPHRSAPAKNKAPKAPSPVITSLTLCQIAHRYGIKVGMLNTMRS